MPISNETTKFVITAETPEDKFNMEFTIPVVVTRSDWEEIARMYKQISVILAGLPQDPAVVENIKNIGE